MVLKAVFKTKKRYKVYKYTSFFYNAASICKSYMDNITYTVFDECYYCSCKMPNLKMAIEYIMIYTFNIELCIRELSKLR